MLVNMPLALAAAMRRYPVPTVSLSLLSPPGARTVLVDNKAAGRMAAESLLGRGFRHLAFVGGSGHPECKQRLEGFLQAARKGGAAVIEDAFLSSQRHDALALGRRIAALPRPLGIMGFSDGTARMVVDACGLAGLAVPEEIAVIGMGNDPVICESSSVPLSSVCVDYHQYGYQAARLLDDLMCRRRVVKRPVLIEPSGVAERQSTDILAVPDVRVARALRHIWQDYTNPRLGVGDIAAAAGMSVSALNNAFKLHLGTPVGWQIRHKRFSHAMDLLAGSQYKVHEIAAACGYRDEHHLRSTLQAQTGLSPRAWRKKNRDDAGGD
ncbi:MAG: substrate-binding domain-containing protein [Planctomycetaceae bacterium]|nr:substrate-binding domain-containing protein [Planctomycetaceae bacterium]